MQQKSKKRTARGPAASGCELALAAAVPRILAAPAECRPAPSDDRAALDQDPIFETEVTVDSLADASSAVEWQLIAVERRENGSLSSEYTCATAREAARRDGMAHEEDSSAIGELVTPPRLAASPPALKLIPEGPPREAAHVTYDAELYSRAAREVLVSC